MRLNDSGLRVSARQCGLSLLLRDEMATDDVASETPSVSDCVAASDMPAIRNMSRSQRPGEFNGAN